MLNVVMPIGIMLGVVMLNVIDLLYSAQMTLSITVSSGFMLIVAFFIVMLSVIMLSVILLSFIMLSVVMQMLCRMSLC